MAHDIERNKQLISEFFSVAAEGGDMLSYLADDMEWWVPGSFELGGTYKKEELPEVFGAVFSLFKAPPQFKINHITAEEDRVAVDCKSSTELLDGTPFSNTYHFLFIIRNGKITVVKEFLNTAYMSQVLKQAKAGK